MNAALLHLMMNHLPVIALPIFLGVLSWGRLKKQDAVIHVGLCGIILAALTVLPVYFTGEPAEEVIEHMAGVSETFIEPHEEAAEVALITTLIAGAAALLCLLASRFRINRNLALNAVSVVALFAIMLLGWTAHLGGQIRHPEIRTTSQLPAEGTEHE
jgi:hypothetical protein